MIALSLVLSQTLMNAQPSQPSPYTCNANGVICFEAQPTRGDIPSFSYTNLGNEYANVEEVGNGSNVFKFSISEENSQIPQKSTIVFKTHIVEKNSKWSGSSWYTGLKNVPNADIGKDSKISIIDIDAPTSTIVLDSFEKPLSSKNTDYPSLGGDTDSAPLFGNNQGDLNIRAKTLQIGGGYSPRYATDPQKPGEEIRGQAVLQILNHQDSGKVKIQSDILIKSDGVFRVQNLEKENYTLYIDGALKIEGGEFVNASISGVNSKIIFTRAARIEDAYFLTFVPMNQNGLSKVELFQAEQGIFINKNKKQEVEGWVAYSLVDFVEGSNVDWNKNPSQHQMPSKLYQYTLDDSQKNALYATPSLSEYAKQTDIVKLINDEKNEIALWFYQNAKRAGDQPVEDALYSYLTSQRIELGGVFVSQAPQSPTPITTSGFDSIDSKLSLIQSGINNTLAEALKNSSNDLLAVNFVNTLAQPHNNTPLTLLEEIKETYKNENLLKQTRENLGVKLSIAQRLAGYALKSTFQGLNVSNRSSFGGNASSNTNSSLNGNNSNALWLNLEGGGVLNGSNFGSNVGFNLGYDTQINQSVLGAYLSYHFMDLKEQSTTLLSHNIEAGLYSRISFFSNEIDLHLRTLLSLANQNLYTQTLIASSSEAKLLSSYTEANLSYGYRFESQDFLSVKPFLGIQVGFAYTPSYSQTGDIQLKFDSNADTTLDANLGVELRKYFTPNSYLYITPSLSQNILQTQTKLKLSQGQALELNSNLVTYAQLLLGGEIDLGKNWSLGMNLGVKQGIYGNQDSKQQWKNQTILIGEIGGVWRF